MSNHWDMHCVTCNVTAKHLIYQNHGEDAVRQLIEARHVFVAMVNAMHTFHAAVSNWALELPQRFELLGSSGRASLFDVGAWLKEHLDHNVRAIDEYGAIDGKCNAWLNCTTCGELKLCVLVLGHDSEHTARNA